MIIFEIFRFYGLRHPMQLVPLATLVHMDIKAFPSRPSVPLLITNSIMNAFFGNYPLLNMWFPYKDSHSRRSSSQSTTTNAVKGNMDKHTGTARKRLYVHVNKGCQRYKLHGMT
ncbi:hypothetical protein T06_3699 [Trichinella sp. T6]|nr:hypothetical protein T06_3699 [Trichinella sp. T6]